MNDPKTAERMVEQAFDTILREQMRGIPILNEMVRVESLGFQEHEGRIIGVVITPWLMNLVMLPGEGDDWGALEVGAKVEHAFPSNRYKFMVNELDGIGRCQTHSLFSPMSEFVNHDHAVAAAQGFLDTLMVERERSAEDQVDEELLGRILRGEETPEIDLDDFAAIELAEGAAPTRGNCRMRVQVQPEQTISRRELLRGHFSRDV